MRFYEFIVETEVAMRNGHTVFLEPWDEDKEAKERESVYMSYIKLPNGTIPPEILALKNSAGIYDVDRIPYNFGETLLRKYKRIGNKRFRDVSPQDTYDYQMQQKDFADFQNEIVQALTSTNEFSTPKSRFYYPNRPEAKDSLQGFRGTAKGLENTAKKFDPADLQFYLGAYKWAVNRRLLDPITADQWAMILLTEGRDDFGFNPGQWRAQQGPGDKQFEQQLEQMGITNSTQRSFISLIRSKQAAVKRTGISFYQAWNGGAQNLGNYNAQAAAVKDPRNKPLVDLVASAIA